jgi:16S rRNA (uracil1498-N3)-methyltransferase
VFYILFFLLFAFGDPGDFLFTEKKSIKINKNMSNKPNFPKSQMFVTQVLTMNYNEKLKMDTWSKQTQMPLGMACATKPILGVAPAARHAAHLNQDSSKTILYEHIMHLNRFYCERLQKPDVELLGGEAHHLYNVYRLKTGDKVELFDGAGTLATAAIEKASSKSVSLKIINIEKIEKPDRPIVSIAVSLPKGERFDWLLEKCTELGVDRIVPVIFERTIKQPKNPKAVQRWQNIAIAAAKQCRRIFLPQIDTPVTLSEVLLDLKKQHNKAEILVGSLEPKSPALVMKRFGTKLVRRSVSEGGDVIAFIGPEGGITEGEKALLEDCGAKFVRLTDTILRVETAALAFAAILAAGRDS